MADDDLAPMQMEEGEEEHKQQPNETDEHEDGAAEEDGEQEDAEAEDGQESDAGADGGAADGSSSGGVVPLKKPMTAYFLFLADERPKVTAQLDAESAAEAAAPAEGEVKEAAVKSKSKNVALVGKLLGERWNALTDEEREVYHARQRALKDAYDAAIAANPALAPKKAAKAARSAGAAELGADSHEALLPLARIKKVMDLDGQHARVTKEALLLTEKAAEHFIAWLSTRAHLQATSSKRRGLRASDLVAVVRAQSRCEFLRLPLRRTFDDMLASETAQAEQRREQAENMRAKRQKKSAADGEGEEEEAKEGDNEDEGDNNGGEADESKEAEGDASGAAAASSPAKGKGKAARAKAKPAAPLRTIDSMFKKVA
jgi:histone H3/H4